MLKPWLVGIGILGLSLTVQAKPIDLGMGYSMQVPAEWTVYTEQGRQLLAVYLKSHDKVKGYEDFAGNIFFGTDKNDCSLSVTATSGKFAEDRAEMMQILKSGNAQEQKQIERNIVMGMKSNYLQNPNVTDVKISGLKAEQAGSNEGFSILSQASFKGGMTSYSKSSFVFAPQKLLVFDAVTLHEDRRQQCFLDADKLRDSLSFDAKHAAD